jgi:hypothetical protein
MTEMTMMMIQTKATIPVIQIQDLGKREQMGGMLTSLMLMIFKRLAS